MIYQVKLRNRGFTETCEDEIEEETQNISTLNKNIVQKQSCILSFSR